MSKPLLLDGALGTELEFRGVATEAPGWTARANLTHPNLIRTIHEEYIRAGADIITANTFRTNPRAQAGGYGAQELTEIALGIAKEARHNTNSQIKIAASVAPVEDCFSPELAPLDDAGLFEEHQTFAKWVADAGADLILIETMSTLREATIALKAARSICALPVYVSFVAGDENTLLDGSLIVDAIHALKDADLLAINCTPLSVLRSASETFSDAATHVHVPFGFIPNASERRTNGTWDLRASTDGEFAAQAGRWVEMGASLIGTCCGTRPQTTLAIHNAIRSALTAK